MFMFPGAAQIDVDALRESNAHTQQWWQQQQPADRQTDVLLHSGPSLPPVPPPPSTHTLPGVGQQAG